MNRPVGAFLAILAGAIDRVDDPNPAFAQALGIVLFLFGKEPVLGPHGTDRVAQELVGGGVTRRAQRLARKHTAGADLQQ